MHVKFIDHGCKKEYLPTRKHLFDVGMDVYSHKEYKLAPHTSVKIPLNFGIEVPNGYVGFILPRSSMAAKGIVSESAPVDPGYTGIIHAIVTNHTDNEYVVNEGDRIAQLVVVPVAIIDFYVDEEEKRQDAGFGSTGL